MNSSDSTNQNAILKELSEIKTSLAVNTNETSNVKATVNKIEITINAMRADFVPRVEYLARTGELDDKIKRINNILNWGFGVLGLAFLSALAKLVIK